MYVAKKQKPMQFTYTFGCELSPCVKVYYVYSSKFWGENLHCLSKFDSKLFADSLDPRNNV